MLPANANVGPYGLGNNAIVDAAAVRCAARARASCTSAPLQARAVIRLGSDVAGLRSRSGRRTEGSDNCGPAAAYRPFALSVG